MYYRFSKYSKFIIIGNIILSSGLLIAWIYTFIKFFETQALIESYMAEHGLIRIDAIRMLTEEGVKLYIGYLLASYVGIMTNVAAIGTLIWYSKTNSFLIGFLSAMTCTFTSFIGGISLFMVFFSRRREIKGSSEGYEGTDDMSKYIHKRLINEGYITE